MSARLFRAIFVGLTLSCIGTGAAVAESKAKAGISVFYGDLDLKSEAGARAMLRRLRDAAIEACTPEEGSLFERELILRALRESCVADAVDEAVKRLDTPLVTAEHDNGRAKSPRRMTEERENPPG
jgi:UrcA family protein